MNEKILIVEDEAGLRLTLSDRLRGEGYEVETAADGPTGLERALAGGHDLILLDVMLPGLPPGKNGFDICRELRERSLRTPILMLTAMGQTADKVRGLKIGADDYLTKPFETSELLARIEALLRRRFSVAPRAAPVRVGRVEVDLKKTEVTSAGEALPLSAKEFHLLKYFLEHPDETLSREVLLHEVWGYDSTPSTRTVDVHVAWLRQKIEEDPKNPKHIVTLHGIGYRFVP